MNKKDCFKYNGSNVLLVEGKNDCHVIWALCKKFKIKENFGINVCESYIQSIKELNSRIVDSSSKPERIGIVIDSDKGYEKSPKEAFLNRWKSIKKNLIFHGYELPDNPERKGTILCHNEEDKPKVGIWLMPNNSDPGMLEHFISEMIEEKALNVAEECVKKAEEEQITSFIPNHKQKAIVHTYLAWQDEPGMPLGTSITTQVLKPETEIAKHFVDWLKRLFDDN